MAKGFKTTTKDLGYKKALETFKKLNDKPAVKIGIMEGSGEHKSEGGEALTVVEVGTFHEFGTDKIPERSFIRSTVDQKFESYVVKSKIIQEKIIMQQMSIEKGLAILGELIQGDIVKTINDGIEPALSEATLKAKTVNGKVGTTPLIDSGQLKQSIRYQVES